MSHKQVNSKDSWPTTSTPRVSVWSYMKLHMLEIAKKHMDCLQKRWWATLEVVWIKPASNLGSIRLNVGDGLHL